MKRTVIALPLLALAVLALPLPAAAGMGPYLGFSLESVAPGGEIGAIRSDFGFAFDGGIRFNPVVALDVSLASSLHDTASDLLSPPVRQVALTYTRVSVGPRIFIPTNSPFEPYFTAGVAYHDLTFDSDYFDMSGWGTFAGVGFDAAVAPHHAISFAVRWHEWDGEDILTNIYKNKATVWTLGWTVSMGP
jgi:hypothetical protein